MIVISVLVTWGVTRQMHQYVFTVQQMLEREIGVKLSEDAVMMHCVIHGAMARRGWGYG
jgi:hypothetical protein